MSDLKKQVVNEQDAADFLGLAVQTLRNRRFTRQPPNYLKLGRSVRYRVEDLESYLNECRVEL